MAKRYIRVGGGGGWQNAPSVATPRNAENLNIMDKGIDDLDLFKIDTDAIVNNGVTTVAGTVLDGRMGKTLTEGINAINNNLALKNWIAPTLQNGWTNFDDGSRYATAGYYKDAFGIVHLKGLLKGGTATAGTPIFTLPAGYAPPHELYFPTVSAGAFGFISVDKAGAVSFMAGTNTNIALSGISFRV